MKKSAANPGSECPPLRSHTEFGCVQLLPYLGGEARGQILLALALPAQCNPPPDSLERIAVPDSRWCMKWFVSIPGVEVCTVHTHTHTHSREVPDLKEGFSRPHGQTKFQKMLIGVQLASAGVQSVTVGSGLK